MTARTGKPPQIASPVSGRVDALGNGDDAIALRAHTEPDVAKLYWFAGQAFLGAAAPREALHWHPAPGMHYLTALDDRGRSSTCKVTLQTVAVK